MYLLSIQEENVSCGDAPPFIKSYEKKGFSNSDFANFK